MVTESMTPDDILRELRQDNPDVTAAIVVTPDGFPIAADTGPQVSEDMLGALAADLLTRAARSAREFGQGTIEELYARAETGHLIVVSAGPEQLLACLAAPEVTLGLLLADVRQAANKLASTAG